YSTFAELDLPIVQTVDVDVSGRLDHYSNSGTAFNPKVGATWQLIPAVMLRGTYSTGFRAPSFSENGTAAAEGSLGENPQVDFPEWSALHNNDEYTQNYPLLLGFISNASLKPETSRNYTLGTVLQPFVDRNISATIDYYNIEKNKAISPAD